MSVKRDGERFKAIGVQTDTEDEEEEQMRRNYEELIKTNSMGVHLGKG